MGFSCEAGELDSLRAHLSALSNSGDVAATPVSVIALQHLQRTRNRQSSISGAMSVLAAVRDVQGIGRGFYVPVPSHRVPWDGFTFLVSSLPNQELDRLYRFKVEAPGASRIVIGEAQALKCLPEISPLEWLDIPSTTLSWTQRTLAGARYQEPIGLENCEVFRAWRGVPRRERWLASSDPAVPDAGTFLVRHRAPDGRANHYLVRRAAGKSVGMSELQLSSSELRRLQFGLRSLAGDPVRFSYLEACGDRGSVLLDVPALPAGEQRLLLALGGLEDAAMPGRWRTKIPNYAQPAVQSVLIALGLMPVRMPS